MIEQRSNLQRSTSLHYETHKPTRLVTRGSSCGYRDRATTTSTTTSTRPDVRIAYTDFAQLLAARNNMRRLLVAARQQQTDANGDNSVRIAQKALRFRNLLAQALAADVEDPAFEINDFFKVTWHNNSKQNDRGDK